MCLGGALGPGIFSGSAELVEAFQERSQSQRCGPVPWRCLACFPHFHLQVNRTCGLYSRERRGRRGVQLLGGSSVGSASSEGVLG